ncbi:MAG: 30S ribosomal protein S8 [Bdellovibrionota bacterium]
MIIDPIADLLIRIKNAHSRQHKTVRIRASKVAKSILELLAKEGFIKEFTTKKDKNGKFDEYEVELKYSETGRPAIKDCKRVSKSGRRVYAKANNIPKVHCGLGMAIVSTSEGVISDVESRQKGIGGEILAYVY